MVPVQENWSLCAVQISTAVLRALAFRILRMMSVNTAALPLVMMIYPLSVILTTPMVT
jgi:hypothetical protein